MDQLIDFVKENLLPCVLILVGFIFLVIVLIFFFKKPKLKNKKTREQVKFDQGLERFEKVHFKKCSKCGGNVPLQDNLCQNCGEIP